MNSSRQWVPFQAGEYLVERAFLSAPDGTAVPVENAVIEVYEGRDGKRYLKGYGKVRPFLMVEIQEENDRVDLILDLGEEFKYRLKDPELHSGKVFSSDVSATLQFSPSSPWEQIPQEGFVEMVGAARFL